MTIEEHKRLADVYQRDHAHITTMLLAVNAVQRGIRNVVAGETTGHAITRADGLATTLTTLLGEVWEMERQHRLASNPNFPVAAVPHPDDLDLTGAGERGLGVPSAAEVMEQEG